MLPSVLAREIWKLIGVFHSRECNENSIYTTVSSTLYRVLYQELSIG